MRSLISRSLAGLRASEYFPPTADSQECDTTLLLAENLYAPDGPMVSQRFRQMIVRFVLSVTIDDTRADDGSARLQ